LYRIRIFDPSFILKETITSFSKMALWGIPGFIIAFFLNYTFNDLFNWNVFVSYFLVSIVITSLNFFIIDQIVFKGEKETNLRKRITGYLSIVYISKCGEWISYSGLVWLTSIHYLIIQFIVSLVFVFIKYVFLKKVHQ